MNSFIFNLNNSASFELRVEEELSLFSITNLYFINKSTNREIFISDSTMVDFLNTIQAFLIEINASQRNLFPPLFETGVGYYYLFDYSLIRNGNKMPCSWSDYLQSLSIATHHNFFWLYSFEGKLYYEISLGSDSFENKTDEGGVTLPEPLETTLLDRGEIEFSALQKIVNQANEIRAGLAAEYEKRKGSIG